MHAPDIEGLRIDLMSHLRGVAPFEELWQRRTTFEAGGENVDLLALEDLVKAKKTQCDKDWPMIRGLVEQDYFARPANPRPEQVEFWLREMRSAELLVDVASTYPEPARRVAEIRQAVAAALGGNAPEVARRLDEEERQERRLDREYCEPLKAELEQMRRNRRRGRLTDL